ncbi:thiamine phosphate synthase [Chloroflexota bacterium]
MSAPNSPTIPYPTLCLVTDRSYSQGQPLSTKVAAAVEGGVNLVHLREKDLPSGQLLALATAIRDVTREKALFLVNDRVDVALAAGADGVQLGEEALPVEAVRRIARQRLLIGRSVHSLQGAREAEDQGADFLLVGTIFPTGSKPETQTAGLQLLALVARSVNVPFLAIGGVNSSNVAQVIAQGAAGAAVISAILAPPDTQQAARELKEAMVAATASPRMASSIG